METTKIVGFNSVLLALGLGVFSLVLPILANAQGQGGQGQNAVYPSSGTCCMGSQAFIDASMFVNQGTNICTVLNFILSNKNYPIAGGVVDARGLNPNNTSMTCSTSPWDGISNPPPSTILLPATGGTGTPNPIIIPAPWILPGNTHLIGAGDGVPDSVNSVNPGTTIQVAGGFSGTAMIQFGSPACVPGGWPTYSKRQS